MNLTGSPRRKINTNKAATAQGAAGATQPELPAPAPAPAEVSAAPAPESPAQDARMRRLHRQELALYMGLLSILFSILMMAGGTYAWYTASVSTAVTTIQAGRFSVNGTQSAAGYSTRSASTPALAFVPVSGEGAEAAEASTEPAVWTDGGTYKLSEPVVVYNDGDIDFQYQAYLCVIESYTDDEKAAENYADKLPANMNLLNRMTFTVQLNDEEPIADKTFDQSTHLYPIKDENGDITGQRAMIPLLSAPKLLEKADPTDENEALPKDTIQVSVQVHNLLATDNGLKLENVSIVINATQNVSEAAAYLGATVVHSAEELQAAVNSGNALIQLGQDIDLGDTRLTVASDITLDLSGYALTSNSQSVIRVTGGTLTLRNAQNMHCATDGTPLAVVGGTVLTNFDPAALCDTPATANEEDTEWTITAD